MGKKSPASKQNTLTSATQRTIKSQDEIAAERTARIANLEKTVERLQRELVITIMLTTYPRMRLMIYSNINGVSVS